MLFENLFKMNYLIQNYNQTEGNIILDIDGVHRCQELGFYSTHMKQRLIVFAWTSTQNRRSLGILLPIPSYATDTYKLYHRA